MTLDPDTLFVTGGLIIVICGVVFLLETLLRRNDPVGRLWSAFFVGAMFATFAYLVGCISPDTWWATGVGSGAYVASLGFIWAGARRANSRRPLIVVPVLAGIGVAAAALVPGPAGGYWAGSMEMFLGVVTLGGLSTYEASRGMIGRLPSARLLAIVLAVVALFYASRAVAFAVVGPDHELFRGLFGTSATSILVISLVVVGTVTLTTIQAERFRRRADLEADTGMRVLVDGVVSREQFRGLAESWLLRSIRERTTLVLLIIEIADLDAINLAFGRAAGDAAIRTAGRLALTHAPTATLIGHLSGRRFGLLMELPDRDSVEAIAARIGEAVLNAPIDDRDRFRASTFSGIATTRTVGARYDDLLRAAAEAVAIEAEAARVEAERAHV